MALFADAAGCAQCKIRSASVFKDLPSPEIQCLDDHKCLREMRIGEKVEFKDAVAVVSDGVLKVISKVEGFEDTVRMLKSGELLSGLSGLVRAQALTPAKLCILSKPTLENIVRSHPGLAWRMVADFDSARHEADRERVRQARHSVRQRIAFLLLQMADRFGDSKGIIPISLTRREISSLAGTTVESAIRVLSDFKKQGWINTARKRFQILQRAPLKALSGEKRRVHKPAEAANATV